MGKLRFKSEKCYDFNMGALAWFGSECFVDTDTLVC